MDGKSYNWKLHLSFIFSFSSSPFDFPHFLSHIHCLSTSHIALVVPLLKINWNTWNAAKSPKWLLRVRCSMILQYRGKLVDANICVKEVAERSFWMDCHWHWLSFFKFFVWKNYEGGFLEFFSNPSQLKNFPEEFPTPQLTTRDLFQDLSRVVSNSKT